MLQSACIPGMLAHLRPCMHDVLPQAVVSGRGRHLGVGVSWVLRWSGRLGAFREEIRGQQLTFRWGYDGRPGSGCWEVRAGHRLCVRWPVVRAWQPCNSDDAGATDKPLWPCNCAVQLNQTCGSDGKHGRCTAFRLARCSG